MNKATKQLLEENNQREKNLSPEGQKVLTDIVAYLRGTSVPIGEQELVRRDITEMLLEGEQRDQSAQEVIGTDYQAFCDEILAELPKRSMKQRIVYALSTVSLSAAALLSIRLVFFLVEAPFQNRVFTPWLPMTLGQFLGGIMLIAYSYGLVEHICRNSFEDRNPSRLQVISFFVCIGLFFILRIFLRQTLFFLHAGIAALLIAVLFLIYKITNRMES